MTTQQAISMLAECASDERVAVLRRVLSQRTRYVTVCLENIFQPQNASAVLRSCDAFGVQDVHIVENGNAFTLHRDIALGSDKWLTQHKYKRSLYENPTREAITQLRKKGYRIVATTPHEGSVTLDKLDVSKGKLAIFFGTEQTGLSDEVMRSADELMLVPMHGFVESLNISVCAAIVLHALTQKIRQQGVEWQLSEKEHNELLLTWLKKSVRQSEKILERHERNGV